MVTHVLHVHLTVAHTGAAAVAAIRVRFHPDDTEAVEQPIDRPEGAEETAEAAVAEHADQADGQHNHPLAGEDQTQHLIHGRVGGIHQVAACALQGTGRADILAEGRQRQVFGQAEVQGNGDHEHRQDPVFQPGQCPGNLAFTDFRHRNLMEQFLDQAHGAQPAADRAAQHHAEEHDHPQHIPACPVSRSGQRVLDGSQRAGACRTGTGIAVQAGHTQRLGLSFINLPFNKSPEVRVMQKRRVQLDKPSL